MKYRKLFSLVLLLACTISGKAEQIKGKFSYTITSYDTSIVYPPSPAGSPAFYIFDVPTQKLKIFNFIESKLGFDYEDRTTYEVSRREGSEPISTREELTDFTISEWKLYEEFTDEFDFTYIGECVVRVDGSWSYSTPTIFGIVGKYGDITAFEDHIPIDLNSGVVEVSISIDGDSASFILNAPVGLKHKIYRCTTLGNWVEVDFPWWGNLTDSGYYISQGYPSLAASENLNLENSVFYKVDSTALEFTD